MSLSAVLESQLHESVCCIRVESQREAVDRSATLRGLISTPGGKIERRLNAHVCPFQNVV